MKHGLAEIIAFTWQLKGKFPVGFDPEEEPGERDITPGQKTL